MSMFGTHFQRGFTLLELLLATALLTLAIAVTGSLIQGLWSSRDRNLRIAGKAELRDAVSLAIRERLTAIMPVSFVDHQGNSGQFKGDRARMDFVGNVRGYLEGGAVQRQTLQAIPDKKGGFALCLSSDSLKSEYISAGCTLGPRTVVLEELKSVTFLYGGRDPAGKMLEREVQWSQPKIIPEWIEIRVTPKSGKQWPPVIVHIPLAMGTSS